MTKVSVVTPTLNVAEKIDHCIDSIKRQHYGVFEHIVVDGGSNDGTVDIARKRGAKVICGADCGVYHAMSKGVQAAQGDVVHILNADDKYANDEIVGKIVEKICAEKLDLCHAKVALVENGVQISIFGREVSRNALLRKMRVAHPSVFVRKTVYERFGLFAPSLRIAGDLDWLLRVWERVQIGYLDRVVVEMSADGLSHRFPYVSYKESLAVALSHGQNIPTALANFYWQLFVHASVIPIRRALAKKSIQDD